MRLMRHNQKEGPQGPERRQKSYKPSTEDRFVLWGTFILTMIVVFGALYATQVRASELGNFYLEQCYKIVQDKCPRIKLTLSPLEGLAGETSSYDQGGEMVYVVKIRKGLWKQPEYIELLKMYEWQATIIHELCHIKAGLKADHNRRWRKCAKRNGIYADAIAYAD